MTDKRFTSQRTDDYNFSDILDNGKWIGICHVDCEDDFVDKLNELHEKDKDGEECYRKLLEKYDKLKEENEQLKKDIDYFNRTYKIEERGLDIVPAMCTIGSPTPSRQALFKENEQLKQDMVIINNILNEYYTSNPSETIKNKLTCLLKELKLFREAHNTVNWQAYKEKEFEGL